MVLHLLVDVEIGRRWRVKAGQQLIYHDQELHLSRLVDEALFHLLLKAFDLVHRRVFRLVEVRRQHLSVGVVLEQLLR